MEYSTGKRVTINIKLLNNAILIIKIIDEVILS